jgi:hypothetical protein
MSDQLRFEEELEINHARAERDQLRLRRDAYGCDVPKIGSGRSQRSQDKKCRHDQHDTGEPTPTEDPTARFQQEESAGVPRSLTCFASNL